MSKRLIVNADDLGFGPNINRGIFEAHARGIVTSSTVMINQPDAPDALEHAREHAPALGLGLHVNLTQGEPVSPPGEVDTLLDEAGRFYSIMQWSEVYNQFDPDQVEAECRAQFARFVALAGAPPDHLDSHHHVIGLHPAALRTALSLAAEYDIPLRQVTSSPDPDGFARILGGMLSGYAQLQQLTETLAGVMAAGPAPRQPDYFNMGFFDQTATLGDLLIILTNLPDGITELMCHPGYTCERADSYNAQREREVAALTHASAREVIDAEHIKLVSFGVL
jgi:predicted glycoside hydrolase/deacetylase ChbG (UPF0249 family)